MKVLFNCSNNVVGGAVQNAANFIKYAVADDTIEYRFVVSEPVDMLLRRWGINREVYKVESPAKSRSAASRIKKIEQDFQPAMVYTMAGPTYVNFKSFHLMGVSDPYITHSKFYHFKYNRPISDWFLFFIKTCIKSYFARAGADHFVFQTNTSRAGFCKRFLLSKYKAHVIANAIGDDFLKVPECDGKKDRSEVVVFCPSAYYPHKDLEIILKLAEIFQEETTVKFVVTVEKGCPLEVKMRDARLTNIVNIGPYSYADGYSLYADCDIVLMPSLLETFSTSYIEAIATRRPLVVADTCFSREICGEYAFYYSPSDPLSAEMVLRRLINAELSVDSHAAKMVISKYGVQSERYMRIAHLLHLLYKEYVGNV